MGRLTLWGMEQYDPGLLDGVQLPSGMNRENFIALLNEQVGPQYPYIQVPPILKTLITSWFETRQNDFQRMYDALYAEYSPIENYDRKEDRTLHTKHSGTDTDTNTLGTSTTVKRTGTESMATTGSEEVATTGTDETMRTGSTTTVTSGSDISEQSVSAYDATGYQAREKNQRTPNLTEKQTPDFTDIRTPDLKETRTPDITETRTPDLSDVSTNSGSDVKQTEYGHQEDGTETIRAHGNIGVTTNQKMITAELEMRMEYDLYGAIISLFERKFMSRVY